MSDADRVISTRDKPGIYDGLESAKPGEPLFTVQGGDPFGPATVLHWVALVRRAAMDDRDDKKAEAMLRKATAAEFVAWAMRSYQRGEVEVVGTRASYQDRVDTPTEDQSDRAALIRVAGLLHNSIAVATDAVEVLAKARLHPEEEVKTRDAIELLREAAFGIEPRRGNERS